VGSSAPSARDAADSVCPRARHAAFCDMGAARRGILRPHALPVRDRQLTFPCEVVVERVRSIRPRFARTIRPTATNLQVNRWGGQDLNLRPTDYESDSALSPTSEIEPRESLTSRFSPSAARRYAKFRSPSRGQCGTHDPLDSPNVVNPSCHAFAQMSAPCPTTAC
jgi:hypothetical protein